MAAVVGHAQDERKHFIAKNARLTDKIDISFEYDLDISVDFDFDISVDCDFYILLIVTLTPSVDCDLDIFQIMTDETEKCSNPLQKTAFCQPNIDVSNFLNLNSLTNHDAFCLAYIFTYRDFSQGTLGLAWVGSPSGIGTCFVYGFT